MRPSLEQAMADHGKSVFAAAYSLLRCREDPETVTALRIGDTVYPLK